MNARTLLIVFVCSLVLGLATGCSVTYQGQEVLFRYDHDADRLDLTLIYLGVSLTDEKKDPEEAVTIIEKMLDHRRIFAVSGLGAFDLEEDDKEALTPREAREMFEVEDVGLFVDDEDRLGGYQELRIHGVRQLIDKLNESISDDVLADIDKGELDKSRDHLDARSRELFGQHARRGGPWLELDDRGITVVLPITPPSWDRLRADLVQAVTKPGSDVPWLLQYLIHVRSIVVEDTETRIHFALPEGSTGRLWFESPKREYAGDRLRRALEDRGLEILPESPVEALRQKFDLSSPADDDEEAEKEASASERPSK